MATLTHQDSADPTAEWFNHKATTSAIEDKWNINTTQDDFFLLTNIYNLISLIKFYFSTTTLVEQNKLDYRMIGFGIIVATLLINTM